MMGVGSKFPLAEFADIHSRKAVQWLACRE